MVERNKRSLKSVGWILGICVLLFLGYWCFVGPTQQEKSANQSDLKRVTHPRAPIIKLEVYSATDASKYLDEQELVIGVEVAGIARAYPANMLSGPEREIFNDVLGEVPLAVTF